MARPSVDAPIHTPAQRKRLTPRPEPYWRQIRPGLHLGYRKGRWIGKETEGGRRRKQVLGSADDTVKADGTTVLSYTQAVEEAMRWITGPATTGGAFADAWNLYLADYKVRSGKDTDNLESAYKKHLEPRFGHLRLDKITTNRIRSWLNGLATTDDLERQRAVRATANKQLTKLKAALNYAYQHGMVSSRLAWDRVKPFKNVDAPRIQFISEEDLQALIKHTSGDFALMVQAALYTGARWSELYRLKREDISPHSVHIATSKSGRSRDIPLNKKGAAFFKEVRPDTGLVFICDGEPWKKSMQQRRMQAACKAAKITPFGFHMIRHHYASQLVRKGAPLLAVSKLLGHADTRTTEKHYAHLQPQDMADVVERLL